jgi:hypothetical protein
VRDVQRSTQGYSVDLGRWRLGEDDPLVSLHGLPVARPGLNIDLGNPHTVGVVGSVIGPLARETYQAFDFFSKYLILSVFNTLCVQKNPLTQLRREIGFVL